MQCFQEMDKKHIQKNNTEKTNHLCEGTAMALNKNKQKKKKKIKTRNEGDKNDMRTAKGPTSRRDVRECKQWKAVERTRASSFTLVWIRLIS